MAEAQRHICCYVYSKLRLLVGPTRHDAEMIAYVIWSLVHSMAVLKRTHLRQLEVAFDAVRRRVLWLFVLSLQRSQEGRTS